MSDIVIYNVFVICNLLFSYDAKYKVHSIIEYINIIIKVGKMKQDTSRNVIKNNNYFDICSDFKV